MLWLTRLVWSGRVTSCYAAPEQYEPPDCSADDISDIYQLGAVFYELFTGDSPFEGELFAVMEQIKHEQPTPPSETADAPTGRGAVACDGERPRGALRLRHPATQRPSGAVTGPIQVISLNSYGAALTGSVSVAVSDITHRASAGPTATGQTTGDGRMGRAFDTVATSLQRDVTRILWGVDVELGFGVDSNPVELSPDV